MPAARRENFDGHQQGACDQRVAQCAEGEDERQLRRSSGITASVSSNIAGMSSAASTTGMTPRRSCRAASLLSRITAGSPPLKASVDRKRDDPYRLDELLGPAGWPADGDHHAQRVGGV